MDRGEVIGVIGDPTALTVDIEIALNLTKIAAAHKDLATPTFSIPGKSHQTEDTEAATNKETMRRRHTRVSPTTMVAVVTTEEVVVADMEIAAAMTIAAAMETAAAVMATAMTADMGPAMATDLPASMAVVAATKIEEATAGKMAAKVTINQDVAIESNPFVLINVSKVINSQLFLNVSLFFLSLR